MTASTTPYLENMRLTKDFYKKSAIELAPKLLGKFLCRKINNKIFKYKITETECYYSEDDTVAMHIKVKRKEPQYYMKKAARRTFIFYGIQPV